MKITTKLPFLIFSNLFLFAVVAFLMKLGVFYQVDHNLNRAFPIITHGPLSIFLILSIFIANLYIPLGAVQLWLFVKFALKKNWFDCAMLVASFSGYVAAEYVFKPIFKVACPATILQISTIKNIGPNDYCFPSGHVTSYVVFFGYLAFLAYRYLPRNNWRKVALAFCLFVCAIVGLTRLYLHAHWLSDVIAGYFLGFGLLFSQILIYLASCKKITCHS
jgi:membrane-associated phospholipid phosphatase